MCFGTLGMIFKGLLYYYIIRNVWVWFDQIDNDQTTHSKIAKP